MVNQPLSLSIKHCVICGERFPSKGSAITCSKECSKQNDRNKKNAARRRQREMRPNNPSLIHLGMTPKADNIYFTVTESHKKEQELANLALDQELEFATDEEWEAWLAERMPPKTRSKHNTKKMYMFDVQQVAKNLDCTTVTVYTRLRRIKEQLHVG